MMAWMVPSSKSGRISGLGSKVMILTVLSMPLALAAWAMPEAIGAAAEKKPAMSGLAVMMSVAMFSDLAASASVHWVAPRAGAWIETLVVWERGLGV